MSDSGEDAPPVPLVLDASVVIAVARDDVQVTDLVVGYDFRKQPLVIPALTVTGAHLDAPGADAAKALQGLERLGNVEIAPLQGAVQALKLARVISAAGLSPWDAHVAAVAAASVCRILTLDAAKWREHAGDLDEPLYIVEIADPEES